MYSGDALCRPNPAICFVLVWIGGWMDAHEPDLCPARSITFGVFGCCHSYDRFGVSVVWQVSAGPYSQRAMPLEPRESHPCPRGPMTPLSEARGRGALRLTKSSPFRRYRRWIPRHPHCPHLHHPPPSTPALRALQTHLLIAVAQPDNTQDDRLFRSGRVLWVPSIVASPLCRARPGRHSDVERLYRPRPVSSWRGRRRWRRTIEESQLGTEAETCATRLWRSRSTAARARG